MRLVQAKVSDFRSVQNSSEFDVGQRTCLVGKNEAGKTAILQALYGLNPIDGFEFNVERDYPRARLNDYLENPDGQDNIVVNTVWQLEPDEIAELEQHFGERCLDSVNIVVKKHYGQGSGTTWSIPINESNVVAHLLTSHDLTHEDNREITGCTDIAQLRERLENIEEHTDKQKGLLKKITNFRNGRIQSAALDLLVLPEFMYFSHYDRMTGQVSVEKLAADRAADTLSEGDKVFLDFLSYAGTNLEKLQAATTFESLNTRCEAASNRITDQIFDYWSQNDSLRIEVNVGRGEAGDAVPFNTGTVVRARVYNDLHRVSVPFSERSAGFIWFFSFLVKLAQVKKTHKNIVILLDEPGLTLHGKAQADLLRYFAEQLETTHQLIYSTHSPFMVPADNISCVRTVEDVVTRDRSGRPRSSGTVVSNDVLATDKDTLFPLQGALGYELAQSLFIAPNTLLVEGPSDILYLQAFSHRLKELGRTGLDARWVIAPSGGIGNMLPMVNLFHGNRIQVAVLVDVASGNKANLRRLEQIEGLKTNALHRITDFTEDEEGDIEDMLSPNLYATLVNEAFCVPDTHKISAKSLLAQESTTCRLVERANDIFKLMPQDIAEFDHYRPAYLLNSKPSLLKSNVQHLELALSRFEAMFVAFNKHLE